MPRPLVNPPRVRIWIETKKVMGLADMILKQSHEVSSGARAVRDQNQMVCSQDHADS